MQAEDVLNRELEAPQPDQVEMRSAGIDRISGDQLAADAIDSCPAIARMDGQFAAAVCVSMPPAADCQSGGLVGVEQPSDSRRLERRVG